MAYYNLDGPPEPRGVDPRTPKPPDSGGEVRTEIEPAEKRLRNLAMKRRIGKAISPNLVAGLLFGGSALMGLVLGTFVGGRTQGTGGPTWLGVDPLALSLAGLFVGIAFGAFGAFLVKRDARRKSITPIVVGAGVLSAGAVLIFLLTYQNEDEAERDALLDSIAAVIESADTVELLFTDINPVPAERWTHPEVAEPTFRDYPVIARTMVDPSVGRDLFARLRASVEAWPLGDSAMCFCPRHAIVATRGDRTVELLICFECSKMRCFIYDGDILQEYHLDVGMEDDARDYFNRIYRDAGISRLTEEGVR